MKKYFNQILVIAIVIGAVFLSNWMISFDFGAKAGSEHNTFGYAWSENMSPEQAKGLEDVDIRSDIYSLGATFYHMVVGEVPFVGSGPIEVMVKHLTEELPYPSQKNKKLSNAVSQVILKMMKKDRNERYQSSAELLIAIENLRNKTYPVDEEVQQKQIVVPHKKRDKVRKNNISPVCSASFGKQRCIKSKGRVRQHKRSNTGTSLRSAYRHEGISKMVFFITIVSLIILVFFVSNFGAASAIIRRIESGEKERVLDEYELHASELLGESISYDRQNPYEEKETIAAKYKYVYEKYPNSQA
ncbi:MAG: hypothetical protein ABH835_02350, partial [Patescibacteria group bacterium]